MTVSVIIPTQGKRSFLSDTIESLRVQTVKPKEVIIVFDESIGNQYAKLNYGVAQSTSDCFIPLPDDDLLSPDYIERTTALMEQTNADVVATALTNFGEAIGVHQPPPKHPYITALFKKSIWEQVGGYDPAIGIAADGEFGMRCQQAGKRVDLGEGLYHFRIHETNLCKTPDADARMQASLQSIKEKHG